MEKKTIEKEETKLIYLCNKQERNERFDTTILFFPWFEKKKIKRKSREKRIDKLEKSNQLHLFLIVYSRTCEAKRTQFEAKVKNFKASIIPLVSEKNLRDILSNFFPGFYPSFQLLRTQNKHFFNSL